MSGLGTERVVVVLDLLQIGVEVLVRLLQEVDEEGLHPLRPCEVGASIPVEELGDALRITENLDLLLLERRVLRRIDVLRRTDEGRLLLDEDLLCFAGRRELK